MAQDSILACGYGMWICADGELDECWGFEWGWNTEDFEGFGVPGGAGLSDDDVVEGGVAFAEAGEADFEDHETPGRAGYTTETFEAE